MTSQAAPPLVRRIIAMVTDRRRYGDAGETTAIQRVVADAARAARAGVDSIQVREPGLPDRGLLDLVRRVAEAADPRVRVLVNGRTDVALAAGAHGVHLPASAPSASRIREIVPEGFLIGRSVHTIEEAIEAERIGGCDYLTFGSVYPTISKPAGHDAAGVEALGRVCDAVRLPVLAIGGIVPERARALVQAGAAGMAAIGMFITAGGDRESDADQIMAARVAQVRASFDAPVPPV